MPKQLLVEPESSLNTPISGAKKRRMILKDTVEKFSTDASGFYEEQARKNHQNWSITPANLSGHVRVIPGDWGDVALRLSQKTGNIYAVLNMANAELPGGLYLEGMGAQEENMYRRSNCHFHVHDEEMDEEKIYYTKEMTDLINGVPGHVYLDVQTPRVCIKGSEGPNISGYDDLSPSDYFLFYELKSAAENISRTNPFSEASMRRKIAAQLDTLKTANIRCVVLSAFGCGAFGNPATEIARIYQEELQKRIGDFDDVVFAIFTSEFDSDNFIPFKNALDGLPLNGKQVNLLTRLLAAIEEQVKDKSWNQGVSFLFFDFKKAPMEIQQMRQILGSKISQIDKIKQLQQMAQEILSSATLEQNNPLHELCKKIIEINWENINDELIDLFSMTHTTALKAK
ncbi:DUF2263 domain-containing protein [Legionella lytica]|uniref:DUF2263 domain-containing protein n=1 Tax=Legionella lytica TaxID=96232 RepID=A0ABY4Y7R6_9GAMM|nr:poly(ADP-ribose) glycohydrolase domain-containing protein [Legionella lytica]USQ13207.1 DUF2263 domain-containing protein [Legionella lytica]